jgi:excisionase family DNA binding protein
MTLLSTEEVAELLRVSPQTVAQWRRKGYGPPFIQERPRAQVLYHREEIDRWLKANRKSPERSE